MAAPTLEMNEILDNNKKNNEKSFFQRNKMSIAVLGLAALTGGAFAAVYLTAATTIPFIVSAAAKIGFDIAALETMSTLVASATIATAGTAALGVIYTATSMVTNALSSAFSWLTTPAAPKTTTTEPDPVLEKPTVKQEVNPEVANSNALMNAVMPPQPQEKEQVITDAVHNATPTGSPTHSRSITPELQKPTTVAQTGTEQAESKEEDSSLRPTSPSA